MPAPASLWLDEAPPRAGAPLDSPAACDVLVVGAGLTGLSAALRLADRGVDVLVLDAAGPGLGASGRNAGFVLLAHVFELPGLASRVGADGVAELLTLGRENHRRLAERFSAAAGHDRAGSLMLSMAGDDAEAAALERAADLLAKAGVEVERGRPHESLSGFGAQLRIPEDAGLHPARLVAAMSDALGARPTARLAGGRVLSLSAHEAHLEGGHRVRFGRALVATNAHAAALVPSLAGVITPQRAQMLATAPGLPRVLREVAYAGWGFEYFRQREDGAVLLGGCRARFLEAEATSSTSPTPEVQAALEAYLRAHLPFASGAPIAHRWAGTMGFSPDELPLLGPAPCADGSLADVDVLVGFTGHGLGLATVLAERWADGVAGLSVGAHPMFDSRRFTHSATTEPT